MGPDQVQQIVQYGVLGMVLALIIAGPLALGRELKRERELTDKALTNNSALATSIDRLTDAVLRAERQ